MSATSESASPPPASTPPQTAKLPQKRYFRQRAHANPFSDHQLV
ncbi:hypothetical protein BC938DRAFT_481340, partial [Jimgerdemannia flammicorona]